MPIEVNNFDKSERRRFLFQIKHHFVVCVRRQHDPPHRLNMHRCAWLDLVGLYQVELNGEDFWLGSGSIYMLLNVIGKFRTANV